jgi:hypothetical protein
MPDSDQSLKIQITIASDVGGGREVLDILKQITDASKKSGSAAAGHAESQRILGLRMQDVREIGKDRARQFPLIGAAMEAAMDPVIATARLLMEALTPVIDKLTEANRAAEELAHKHAEWQASRSGLKIHRDTAEKATTLGASQNPFGQALLSERDTAGKIPGGHAGDVSPEDQKVIQQLGSLIAGHNVTLEQAAAIIAKADSNNASLLVALKAFDKTADGMKTFSAASAAKFDDVTATLKAHAAQISRLTSRPPNVPPS